MKIWKWIKIIILIILPVCLLIFTTASNLYIYNQSTLKVETIKFPSPNGNIVSGDLYYPRSPFSIPCPVVIYLHGLSWSKDSDARFPIDLARKGIAVITLDQEGHGQTTGGILGRDTLGPFFWKNVIGAIDYIYLRNDIFNTSAIGVFGHSLGGWATLMASVTDPRITASISLAGPSNLTAFPEDSGFETQFRLIGIPFEEDILHNPDLRWNHSAVHYINGTFPGVVPKNLLLLYGTADTLVPLQHGLDMNKTINDSSRCTLEIMNGSDHGLMNVDFYYTNVRIIQFFQEKLLGIEPESRSKIENDLIFLNVYINHLLSLFLILYFIAIIGFFIYYPTKNKSADESEKHSEKSLGDNSEKPLGDKLKILGKIIGYLILVSIPVLGIWILTYYINLLLGNLILALIIAGILLVVYSLIILYFKDRNSFKLKEIRSTLKSELNIKSVGVGILLGIILILIYWLFGCTFKIIFPYPRSYLLYIEALILIIPVIGIELVLRKLIQDELLSHNKRNRRFGNFLIRFIMVTMSICLLSPILLVVQNYYFTTTIFTLFLIGISLPSIYLYEKSDLSLTILFETVFLAFILANSYYLFI